MMREWFPTLRIVAYGDHLDEIAVEGLYFVGADAVLSTLLEEEEVITAILMRTLDAGVPKIPDPVIAVAKEALQADSDIVRVEERAEVMGETTEAIQEPALGMDEPPPAVEEPTPAPEEPAPAMEESQQQEETSPPPRRPPLLRSLGLRSGTDRAGRTRHRVKPHKVSLKDEQRQAIDRNLERLVRPWPSPEEEAADPEEAGVEEQGSGSPKASDSPNE